jgi:protein-S-isoprenylcysteine O-methyltransferase Ste14
VRKPAAAVTSVAFFALAPGVVAGLLPWYFTNGWARNDPRNGWLLGPPGVALVVAGVAVLVHAFARYVIEGFGTPAPVAPTERLVIAGPNRYVRNPMYVSVVAIIVGQAMLLAQPVLLVYATGAFATMAAFVYGYEEPTLARQFGPQYDAYCERVPRWRIPRAGWRRSKRSRPVRS